MKEIRTIKMVEQTEVKFIADDGTEFSGENAERLCRDYERTKDVNRVKEEFKRVDFTELKLPFVAWFSDDNGLYKAVLNSRRDYVAMMDYIKVVWNPYDIALEEPTAYPYNMIVSASYDYVCEYNRDLESELREALKQLETVDVTE